MTQTDSWGKGSVFRKFMHGSISNCSWDIDGNMHLLEQQVDTPLDISWDVAIWNRFIRLGSLFSLVSEEFWSSHIAVSVLSGSWTLPDHTISHPWKWFSCCFQEVMPNCYCGKFRPLFSYNTYECGQNVTAYRTQGQLLLLSNPHHPPLLLMPVQLLDITLQLLCLKAILTTEPT